MRIRTYDGNNITVNGVRSGFTLRDAIMLRRETEYTPKIQQFTLEDDEIEEPEERTYWCAICKGRLTYLEKTNTIWRCDNCTSYYDTKIQDKPIKNKSGFKLRSYHNPYQQFDENDPNIVFVEGIKLDQDQQEGIEVIRSSEDKRVQNVHVKGNLADALSAMHRYEERQSLKLNKARLMW